MDRKVRRATVQRVAKSDMTKQANILQSISPFPHEWIFWLPPFLLHIVCKPKRPWIGKAIVRKKNGDRWINLTNFRLHYKKLQRQRLYYTKSIYIQRLYYKAITKTIWYWHKNKNRAKKNRTETPEINPCTHEYLIFLKGGRNIQWRKDSLLAGKTEQLHVSEWN